MAYCDSENTLRFTAAYGTDPGEAIAWPCPAVVTVQIDADRQPLLVVAAGGAWHFLAR